MKVPIKRTLNLHASLADTRGARQSNRSRGQAMVEMALAVTVLLLITVGILQYGIIMNATITLSQIARDGARYAGINALPTSTNPDPDPAIKNYVRTACESTTISASDLPDSQIEITPALAARKRGGPITVTLKYPMGKKIFAPISFPGLSNLTKNDGNYKKAATMIIEG